MDLVEDYQGTFFLSYITYCNIFNIVLLTEVHVLVQQKRKNKKKIWQYKEAITEKWNK